MNIKTLHYAGLNNHTLCNVRIQPHYMSLDAEKVTCAKCIGKMIREGIVKIVFVKNPSTFEPEDTPARDDPFWKTEPIDKHLPGYKESLVQIPITEAEKLAKYKNASFHFKDLGYEK